VDRAIVVHYRFGLAHIIASPCWLCLGGLRLRVFRRAVDKERDMSERTPVIDPPRTLVEGQHLDQPTFHALYEANRALVLS
jgi:hypothetical protein